jgi:hypothetical protein
MLMDAIRSLKIYSYHGYKIYIHNLSNFDGIFGGVSAPLHRIKHSHKINYTYRTINSNRLHNYIKITQLYFIFYILYTRCNLTSL